MLDGRHPTPTASGGQQMKSPVWVDANLSCSSGHLAQITLLGHGGENRLRAEPTNIKQAGRTSPSLAATCPPANSLNSRRRKCLHKECPGFLELIGFSRRGGICQLDATLMKQSYL